MEGHILESCSDTQARSGITLGKVVEAYYSCRKNKRNTYSSLVFEKDLFSNLKQLYEDILSGNYKSGRSICFVVKRPKVREVWAAQFRDRVVHHILFNEINPYWEKRWSADSCATIKGRGTLYGARRLRKHYRSISENYSKRVYYLKCDLANFFNSIDKNILWELLLPSFKESWVEDVAREVLFNDPSSSGIYLSTPEEYSLIPKRKRLSEAGKDVGIPIGNLTSQLFANVLLNELDQFVKRKLKAKKYIRYVDDFIILSRNKEDLKYFREEIDKFLPSIKVRTNPKKTFIHSAERGIDFVGHKLSPFRWNTLTDTKERSWKRLRTNPEAIDSYVSLFLQSENSLNLIESTLGKFNLETRVKKLNEIRKNNIN